MDIVGLLKKCGIEVIDISQGKSDMEMWKEHYCGYVENFHEYRVFNGIKYIDMKRPTLRMAKRVCEDWASLLMNEKVLITALNEQNNKILKTVFHENRFYFMANRLIEMSFALGTGAFVESIRDGKVTIDYVRGEYIYPIALENGIITECAFSGVTEKGKEKTYYVQVHKKEGDGYRITNLLFNSEGEQIACEGCLESFYSPVVLFQIVMPNKVNTRKSNSPFGASVFSESLDVLFSVDLCFDSFVNEFKLGKKRITVPMSMAKKQITAEGKQIPVFDTNDVVFYAMDDNSEEGAGVKEINMDLRVEDHVKGLETILSVLSDKCGLGSGRYTIRAKDNAVMVKTATEVVSEKSDLWQNIRNHEILLEQNLKELAVAVLHLKGKQMTGDDVTVLFDDSVITDKTAELSEKLQLVSVGALLPYEVRAWYTGESEEEAKKKCEEDFDDEGI